MGRDVLLLYMSPKNPKYTTQTNEGAVRYLIKEKETPDCILALCSETVRKKAVVEMPDGSTCTTLEYFRDALRRVGIPAERLVVIEVPDSMDDEKKQFQAISQLLEKINEGDTLSIDLSGGMRDTAMLLVTAARCMRDLRGVQTRRVIYGRAARGRACRARPHPAVWSVRLYYRHGRVLLHRHSAKAGGLSVERG